MKNVIYRLMSALITLTLTLGNFTSAGASSPFKSMSESAYALATVTPNYMIISRDSLMALPISDTSWKTIKSSADASATPDLCNQDNKADVNALAAGIVYARTGDANYKTKVINLINNAMASQRDGCYNAILAMGRQLGGYVLAADFANYHDPSFTTWLTGILDHNVGGHSRWNVLRFTAYDSASNWGVHALASTTTADIYLSRTADIAKDWAVFSAYGKPQGWPFNKASSFNEQWSCVTTEITGKLPIAINSPCAKSGINLDGAPVEDSSRSSFGTYSSYIHESLQGYAVMAQLFERTGLNGWTVNNSQVCRAAKFGDRAGRLNDNGVSYFVAFMANRFCGSNLPTKTPTSGGRMFGFSDWLFSNGSPVPPTSIVTATKTPTTTIVSVSLTPTVVVNATKTSTIVSATKTPTAMSVTKTSTPLPTNPSTVTPTFTAASAVPTNTPTAVQIFTPTQTNTQIATVPSQTATTLPAGQNTVEVRVANGADDVEERVTGSVYTTSNDLELVYDTNNQIVGLRFVGVNIPNGAIITNAYLQFKVDEVSSEITSLSIQGEASSNALAFVSTTGNVSLRVRTKTAVGWSPVPWLTAKAMGPDQQTPNLAFIVQEIVNQPGWVAGNPVVMIISGSGKRIARAYEINPADAPLLHVEFTTNGVVVNNLAPLSIGTAISTELPTTLLTTTTATPVSTQTATSPSPSATISATFTSTVSPEPLLLPSLTPTSLNPVLLTFSPTVESVNKMSIINQQPVITSNGSPSIAENTTTVTTITATDADLPAQALTYSISGGTDSALFSINPSSGELTFITAPDYETPMDAGIDNIYNVAVQASDGILAATQEIAVTITAMNDISPTITSNGSASIDENTMAVTVVTAADADLPAQALTYSISGGADSALFSINPSTGELAFITTPDYEVPTDSGLDNVYNLTVQASDGTLAVTQDIVITITAVNDINPTITSNGNASVAENTTTVTTVTATDADLPAQALTYSISSGTDSALFNINPSTGELTFITTPDYEIPMDAGHDNIYNLTVQASDGTLATTQDIVVTVTAVNDNNPKITSNGSASIDENTTTVITVTAIDADLPAQALTYSISGGADSALFSINPSTGELAFITAPDYEVPTDVGLDNVYNLTVQASDGTLTAKQDIVVSIKDIESK